MDELPAWFIRHLNLEPEPVTPRFPPELLQFILARALEGQPPVTRQRTRNRFRLVCRGWADSVAYWRELDVVGSARLHGLARHFARPAVRPKLKLGMERAVVAKVESMGPGEVVRRPAVEVRSLYVELDDVDEGGWSLLRQVTEVEKLEINSVEGWYLDSTDGGASRTTTELAKLKKVQQFKLGGPPGEPGAWPVVGLSWVKEVIFGWPDLKRLALDGCEIHPSADPPATPLIDPRANPALRAIHARSFGTDDAIDELLAGLHGGITELVLDDTRNYTTGSWTTAISAHLPALAARLTSLSLLDSPLDSTRLATARGAYDALVPSLKCVHRLAINPCALSLLSTLLALPGLTELTLVSGCAEPVSGLSCGEVVDYLGRVRGLRRLALPRKVLGEGVTLEVREVEAVARERGVELEWEWRG